MALKRASRPRLQSAPPALPTLPPSLPPPAPLTLPYPNGVWRILAFVVSVAEPAVGLAFAFFYWRGVDTPVRRFARICLALAILGFLIEGGSDAVQSGLTHSDRFIQPY